MWKSSFCGVVNAQQVVLTVENMTPLANEMGNDYCFHSEDLVQTVTLLCSFRGSFASIQPVWTENGFRLFSDGNRFIVDQINSTLYSLVVNIGNDMDYLNETRTYGCYMLESQTLERVESQPCNLTRSENTSMPTSTIIVNSRFTAVSRAPDVLWKQPVMSDSSYEVKYELKVFAENSLFTNYTSAKEQRIEGLKFSTDYTVEVVAVPMKATCTRQSPPQILYVTTSNFCDMNWVICFGVPLIIAIIAVIVIIAIIVIFFCFRKKHCSIHPCKQSSHHKNNVSGGTSGKRSVSESSASGSSTGSGKPLLV
jgi:hypothetical protein